MKKARFATRLSVAVISCVLGGCSSTTKAGVQAVHGPTDAGAKPGAALPVPSGDAPRAVASFAVVATAEMVPFQGIGDYSGVQLARDADGNVQFAIGFLSATGPRRGGGPFVPKPLNVDGYSEAVWAGATQGSSEDVVAVAPFSTQPVLTIWSQGMRSAPFATVFRWNGTAWKSARKGTAYLPSAKRGNTTWTIEVFTPTPKDNCSPAYANCVTPKAPPAHFVALEGTDTPAPKIPKGFCPERLLGNPRGDLYVVGRPCEAEGQETELLYYAPNATEPVRMPSPYVTAMAVAPSGDAFIATQTKLQRYAPGGKLADLAGPAKQKGDVIALGVEASAAGDALWVTYEGAVYRQMLGASQPWEGIPGPWTSPVTTMLLTDAEDPILVTRDGAIVRKVAVSPATPQVLPGLRLQIRQKEAARPRKSVQSASKCPERAAFVSFDRAKLEEVSALLDGDFDGYEARPARVVGLAVGAVFAPFPDVYSAKQTNNLAKKLAPLGGKLQCGFPVSEESL